MMDVKESQGRTRSVLAAVGLALSVALAAGAGAWFLGERSAAAQADAVRDARVAAEQAVVPVLSYDHRDLEAGQRVAQAHLTSRYREQYDETFRLVADNAPSLGTVVEARLVSSAVVRPGEDRVQVLVFVDQETTNKRTAEPVVYQNHVTLTMEKVDGEWLVDDLATQG